jgi:6-methylsalicylate decarboxylase
LWVVSAIDLHQHLWSEPLLAALAARDAAPRVERSGPATFALELAGEPVSTVPADDLDARAALVRRDGLDRAFIALSTALGVEFLPSAQAAPLLAAWDETADALPAPLRAWSAVSLTGSIAEAAAALELDARAGLCLPAAALGSPAAVERLGPLLDVVEAADRPVFVHPGPAATDLASPAWWPALTDYVAQLHAAWLAFAHAGRPAHPRLRVVFAALAGLAPLQVERLTARGGATAAAALGDDLLFYETSSYGPRGLDAMAEFVGLGQLVYGSDRPVVEPDTTALRRNPQRWRALTADNPARLFAPDPVPTP